jgi:hypothetical protein
MKFHNPILDPTAAATLVKKEWLQLIRIEGIEAAKSFMEACRLRDFSPSSHCDVEDFLQAGHSALRIYVGSKINEALQESDYF